MFDQKAKPGLDLGRQEAILPTPSPLSRSRSYTVHHSLCEWFLLAGEGFPFPFFFFSSGFQSGALSYLGITST